MSRRDALSGRLSPDKNHLLYRVQKCISVFSVETYRYAFSVETHGNASLPGKVQKLFSLPAGFDPKGSLQGCLSQI